MSFALEGPFQLRIRCAICKRPVDQIVITSHPEQTSTQVKVHCHGDVDVMQITTADLQSIEGLEEQIVHQEGLAFMTKAIEQKLKEIEP